MNVASEGFVEIVGLLISCDIRKKSKEALYKLWAENNILYVFVCPGTISYSCFFQFLNFVGFGGKNTHEERKDDDKTFSNPGNFVIFAEKFKLSCITTTYGTANEGLVSFREQCPFRQCTTMK
jgi:hypothetical protein